MVRIGRFVLSVAVCSALFVTTKAARAVPLSALLAGESISAGNLTFTDWTLLNVDLTGDAVANPDAIQVFPLTNDPANPGLGYQLGAGGLESAKIHSDASIAEFTYSFLVTTNGPPMQDTTFQVTSYDALARAGTQVRVVQIVQQLNHSILSFESAFARVNDPPDAPNFTATEEFPGLQTTARVVTAIAASGANANDFIALRGYEQRFGLVPVPEPGAGTLCVALVASAAALRVRRKRVG